MVGERAVKGDEESRRWERARSRARFFLQPQSPAADAGLTHVFRNVNVCQPPFLLFSVVCAFFAEHLNRLGFRLSVGSLPARFQDSPAVKGWEEPAAGHRSGA